MSEFDCVPPYFVSQAGYSALCAWHERALEHLPPSLRIVSVETQIGKTVMLTAGEFGRPPVILLHGINVNATIWTAQLQALAPHAYVIAPDVPGFLGKSAPVRLPYFQRAYADWLRDILDALGLPNAWLVGSSAGGYFALEFAATYPERVCGLVLMNPSGVAPYRPIYQLSQVEWGQALIHWVSVHLAANPRFARWLVQRAMNPNRAPTPDNIELAYLILKYYKRYPPPAQIPRALLARVLAPTLLLTGANEIYTDPHAVARRLQAELPNLTAAHVIPNAGHDLNKEVPTYVTEAIRAFIGLRSR
ncbi:MAG: alpha/beta fold hydrolase [Phototrophicaceae bacterium]|jgi:pimeloyl-ACP methyl ester carboxylesterase